MGRQRLAQRPLPRKATASPEGSDLSWDSRTSQRLGPEHSPFLILQLTTKLQQRRWRWCGWDIRTKIFDQWNRIKSLETLTFIAHLPSLYSTYILNKYASQARGVGKDENPLSKCCWNIRILICKSKIIQWRIHTHTFTSHQESWNKFTGWSRFVLSRWNFLPQCKFLPCTGS